MNLQQQRSFSLPVSGFPQEQTFCGTEPTQMPIMSPQNTYSNIPPPCGQGVEYQPQWPSFQDQTQATCPPMQENIVYGEGTGFPMTSGPGMDFTREVEFEPGMGEDRGMVKNGAMAIGAVGLAAVAYKALKGKKCKKNKYGHNSSRELEIESNPKDYSKGFGDEFY